VSTQNNIFIKSPLEDFKRQYVLKTLGRYWPKGSEAILHLPIPVANDITNTILPPQMILVQLPEWATEIGIGGSLLVPAQSAINGPHSPHWSKVDWLGAVFWYLNGTAEREFETKNGPIHSYSSKLQGWDKRIWERAWVNRIALFLRKWATQNKGLTEEENLGPIPDPEIIITHDVDAVKKTTSIRFKQTAFHLFNSMRLAASGNYFSALHKIKHALRFFILNEDYWCFEKIITIEQEFGIKSFFNFYGGAGGLKRNFKQRLLDPAYDITEPKISDQVKKLYSDGWQIGLHQSSDAWDKPAMMRAEKNRLENSLGHSVRVCRQHWLRFSWEKTWKAQDAAGLVHDMTLGFNDRPGFRNGSALQFHPWDSERNQEIKLSVTPLFLMDSHLYDYQNFDKKNRHDEIRYWIDEIKAVNGTASIDWHQQVMNDDYGWYDGYVSLLNTLVSDN
jgi:hypothetical protein